MSFMSGKQPWPTRSPSKSKEDTAVVDVNYQRLPLEILQNRYLRDDSTDSQTVEIIPAPSGDVAPLANS